MKTLVSTNPSKGYQLLGEVEVTTPEAVQAAVSKAHAAKKSWQELGIEGRCAHMRTIAGKFEADKERFALLEAEEMGMPLKEALDDVDISVEFLNSYIDQAARCLQPLTTFETANELHQVFHEPYGVTACIVPWNFPLNNFVWQCGQNLVAGNTIVFKHSEETPLCGKLLEEIVNSVLPEGVFNEIYGDGAVGQQLISSDVNLVCFTGSSKTGITINETATKRLLPTVMELGGSAPGIVFEDANIGAIKETIYGVRFSNCGQMCDALKRLIVHETTYEAVVEALTSVLAAKKIGTAADPTTDIGPLVAQRQLDVLEAQVADAIKRGAAVLTGGKKPAGLEGAYFEPTLLTNITPDMRVWHEEVFGPVLPIMTFKTEEEAITLANDTRYGLGAYIFTEDNERFRRVAHQLESGMVSQNSLSYVNVHNPFTGYKMSGSAREHAQFGFDEVTQLKVIAGNT
jgi:succinate-semialdehyde dehydrogenase/glutarate-semialdehyde dehydrogenase